jgi:hypothetical protein
VRRLLELTRQELEAWRERVRGAGDAAEDAELISRTLPRLRGELAPAPFSDSTAGAA